MREGCFNFILSWSDSESCDTLTSDCGNKQKRTMFCHTFESASEMGWKICQHNFMLYVLMYTIGVAGQSQMHKAVHSLNKTKDNRLIQKDEVKENEKRMILYRC